MQKLFYLPEAHTDFLFAVLAEELGLVGMAFVIGMFSFLVWRAFDIARRSESHGNLFGSHLAYGLGLLIGLQAFVNIGVNMGILPTKGLTLAADELWRLEHPGQLRGGRVAAAYRPRGEADHMSHAGRSKVLIMAGGTGGHVYPALAVAERLRANGNEVIWLGVRQGLEADLVPRAGIPICYVKVSGLRGKGIFNWIAAPFRLVVALIQSMLIIGRSRPRVVLGMGGFVAGPGGLAAWLLRRPLLIHEQNAIPGLTNRLLAASGKTGARSFPRDLCRALCGDSYGKSVALGIDRHYRARATSGRPGRGAASADSWWQSGSRQVEPGGAWGNCRV